jgi:hypothetical protein
MNCERASSALYFSHRRTSHQPGRAVPSHNVSSNFESLDQSVPPNLLISIICKKSAQIIENRYFQVPVFCDTCALFLWKPLVFSALTKTPLHVSVSATNPNPKQLLEIVRLSLMFLNTCHRHRAHWRQCDAACSRTSPARICNWPAGTRTSPSRTRSKRRLPASRNSALAMVA